MAPMVPGALYRAQESYGARSVSGFADATGEQGVGMTSWLRLTEVLIVLYSKGNCRLCSGKTVEKLRS